jgi:hypothetical protein
VVRQSWSYSPELVEDAISENQRIQGMFNQLVQWEIETDEAWDEMFEDMMQTARAHFVTEARDVLPLIDRSRDV